MTIAENVALVKKNIAAAALAAGREPDEIMLVAASKTNSAARVREAIAAGVDACGENRVQEMLEKCALGAYEGAPLHFIGHLQRNKVKNVVGLVSLIHSVDTLELLRQIDRVAAEKGLVQDVLLEINIGAEASKSGFAPEELPSALAAAAELECVRIRGLMAIPPICASGEENRQYFVRIQQLFVDNCDKKYDNVRMDFMSMGMSGDYETAVECGAHIVRVGTAIFGPRVYPEKH
jgi:pyridoxal phosphate enzyme (YggS family)